MTRAKENALEVLRTAMQIERDSYALYRAAAAATRQSSGVKLFLSLARDEMEHLAKLEIAYCSLTKAEQWPSLRHSTRRKREVFPASEQVISDAKPDSGEVTALLRDIQAERDSIAFYQSAMEEATDAAPSEMYRHLLGEEKAHLSILQAEYDHLTQTGFWFNDQEFSLEVRGR